MPKSFEAQKEYRKWGRAFQKFSKTFEIVRNHEFASQNGIARLKHKFSLFYTESIDFLVKNHESAYKFDITTSADGKSVRYDEE